MAATPQRKTVHADIKLNNDPELATRFLDVPNMPWETTKFPASRSRCSIPTTTAAPPRCSSWRPAPWCRCTSTPRWSRPTCWKARSRTTRACAGPASSAGGRPATSTRPWRPTARVILGFFLKPNRFAYGEKFFTEAGQR